MGKWLLVVESNCKDPARVKEFNDWYNKTHIPDIFETPCFVKASRYELPNPPPGKGKYIAVYEIQSDNFDADMARHNANMKNKLAQGRFTDLLGVVSRGIYTETYSFQR